MKRWLVVLLLPLAGCISDDVAPEPEPSGPDWAQVALISGDGHDHTDPAQHANGTTPNFVPLGQDPMISDHYGVTAGGYLCGDAAMVADGRVLAVVESRSDVGFAIVDVSDPSDPEWLGELVMENSYVYDLVVVPDGRHVVLATAHTKGPDLPASGGAPRLVWTTPCGTVVLQDPIPREASAVLVDISDPSQPQVTSTHRLLGRGHSAFAVDQDGRPLIMITTLGPDVTNSWVQLFTIDDVSGQLLPFSNYREDPTDTEAFTRQVWHDGWIHKDPQRGWLMHIVGTHTYQIHDVNDPMRPRLLAEWTDWVPDAGGYTGNLHGVIPILDFQPGLDIAIIGPEWGGRPEDHPTGIIRVLDITDLDNIGEIGAWTLPYDVVWDPGATYLFSNHYYSVAGDTMFVSMYHGGIWAVDLSPLRADDWVNLPSIGVWQPLAPDVESAITVRWAPTNEEVFAFGDTIVTFDSNTGLHTATWTGEAMPAPEPWPLAPLR